MPNFVLVYFTNYCSNGLWFLLWAQTYCCTLLERKKRCNLGDQPGWISLILECVETTQLIARAIPLDRLGQADGEKKTILRAWHPHLRDYCHAASAVQKADSMGSSALLSGVWVFRDPATRLKTLAFSVLRFLNAMLPIVWACPWVH